MTKHHLHQRSLVIGVLVLAAVLVLFPAGAFGYSGFLTSADGGILGSGNWLANGPTTISWDVTFDAVNSWWNYSYQFSHPAGETSHFILEVSDNFTGNDLFNVDGDYEEIAVGMYDPGESNPNMPGEIYGIKFDDTWGLTTQLSFSSYRVPVWQDFYAKDGQAGGYGWNAAWNAGFLADDPGDPAADGSIANHILAPDSVTEPVPEPTTILLLGSGLLGFATLRRLRPV